MIFFCSSISGMLAVCIVRVEGVECERLRKVAKYERENVITHLFNI